MKSLVNISGTGKKVLGSELFYATSDLGKILGCFNSCIQAHKLIVMNETGMFSEDWNKYNDHLKSLITEDYLTVECKGTEPKVIKDYAGFMVLSNHDASLWIEMGDHHIVCFDVSSCYKGNMVYFKNLAKELEHPNAPNVVMAYLLSLDISDWNPQDIPATKMKTDIINGENPFTNKKFGKTPPTIGIECKQARINGKRDWVYTLDRSKIMRKLRESGIDIEEFSNTPQGKISSNASTDIPVFNVSEIVDPKGKEIVSTPPTTNMTQDLFNSKTNESLVASSFKSIDISPPPEIIHVELVDDKSEPVSEIIKPVNDKVESSEIIELINDPEISPDLSVNNEPKTINEEQREIRLRQKAIELGENPDKFITITEKDRDLARIYYDKIMADVKIIEFARSDGVDSENYMKLSR
ncbi:14139_t:CDS:2 [Cetraspora pellucida]|uniref:14139_t:CDS:1 n=1 Tax=Cetraspora pellucida TaxID=1433469 RepID=A0A9N9HZN4_9GLOM|nr:14139_t:CDS:2 [Cetraspora pellucida]